MHEDIILQLGRKKMKKRGTEERKELEVRQVTEKRKINEQMDERGYRLPAPGEKHGLNGAGRIPIGEVCPTAKEVKDAQQRGSCVSAAAGEQAAALKGEKSDYYRASIKTDKRVFADEVVKHDMLSLLWKETVRWRYEVIAFTLLDDQLQLILARRTDETPARTGSQAGPGQWPREADPGKEILEDLKRGCRMLYSRSSGCEPSVLRETSSWEKLERPDDVLRECCDIHQMPVTSGYVDKVSKYWWSSYTSYRGKYYWKFLNCKELLDRFSADSEKASLMFCREQTNYARRMGRKEEPAEGEKNS